MSESPVPKQSGTEDSPQPTAPARSGLQVAGLILAGVVGAVLVLGYGMLALIRNGGLEGSPFGYGSFVGAVAITLVLAFVVRLVWVKLIRRRGQVQNWPWLLLVAGVIALVLSAARADQAPTGQTAGVSQCADPLAGSGLVSEPTDPAVVESFAAGLPPDQRRFFEMRTLRDGKARADVALFLLGPDPAKYEEYLVAFRESAGPGVTLEASRIGGTPVHVVDAVQGGPALVLGHDGCHAVIVSSPSEADALAIAERAFAEN